MESRLLYILTTDIYKSEHIYKIGYTQNLKLRLSTLNTGRIPSDRLYDVFLLLNKNADELEKRIHKRLSEFRLANSEFFHYPLEDLINICKSEHDLLETEKTDNFEYHSYNTIQIKQRVSDGYFSMEDMCKVSTTKTPEEFFNSKFGDNAVTQVIKMTSLNKDCLVQTDMLGKWCHPQLAPYLASWISRELWSWVFGLVFSYKKEDIEIKSLKKELDQIELN